MSIPTPDPETGAVTVGHLTVTPLADGKLDAMCGFCHTGLTAPKSFGGIPAETLVLSFAKQHVHAPKPARRPR